VKPAHVPLASTFLTNLAVVLQDQGKFAQAEHLQRQALQMRCKLLGEGHPAVATSLNHLATVLQHQGKLAEAEQLYRQALEMQRRLLADNICA
jgi:Tfp pilus assembly protein PilF